MSQQPLQENFVHSPAEAFSTVYDYHGNARVITGAQLRGRVDIDFLRRKAMATEELLRFIAQVAANARKEEYLVSHLGGQPRFGSARNRRSAKKSNPDRSHDFDQPKTTNVRRFSGGNRALQAQSRFFASSGF
jgi:hypothetical protein